MNTRDEDIIDHARPTNPGYGTNVGKKGLGNCATNLLVNKLRAHVNKRDTYTVIESYVVLFFIEMSLNGHLEEPS
jgi:hypothetical protein